MGELLALASAVCYGIADFAGGLLARRANFVAVALAGQVGGLGLTLVAAPFLDPTLPSATAVTWGALSGVGTGMGMTFLYRGLSHGAMSVVVPVSAVTGVGLPVLVAVVVLGDRPSALSWLGIVLAVPALWLVSARTRGGSAAGTFDALLAGAGIAVQYLALAQAGGGSGIWPVVAGRLAATLAILPLTRARPERVLLPPRTWVAAAGIGSVAAIALGCYLAATWHGLVVVAVVLSSMYPALPVLLGITVLRERLTAVQTAGLAAAAVAVALLAAG